MAKDKQKRGSKAPASRAGAKKRATPAKAVKKPVAKKATAKSAAKKAAAKPAAAKKITARKSVPIKTARVSKRALLPPLPPPPTLKAVRSAARHPSRSKVTKTGRALFEIPDCTEAVLRQKLRLAAPYVELWLAKTESVLVEADGLTPEAAFVRIWQWLMLEATLEGGRVVITPDLVEKLFAEEMGRGPTM